MSDPEFSEDDTSTKAAKPTRYKLPSPDPWKSKTGIEQLPGINLRPHLSSEIRVVDGELALGTGKDKVWLYKPGRHRSRSVEFFLRRVGDKLSLEGVQCHVPKSQIWIFREGAQEPEKIPLEANDIRGDESFRYSKKFEKESPKLGAGDYVVLVQEPVEVVDKRGVSVCHFRVFPPGFVSLVETPNWQVLQRRDHIG